MNSIFRSGAGVLVKGLLIGAGLSFAFGGRALHEFAGVERFQAEILGIAAAVAMFGISGVIMAVTGTKSTGSSSDRAPE